MEPGRGPLFVARQAHRGVERDFGRRRYALLPAPPEDSFLCAVTKGDHLILLAPCRSLAKDKTVEASAFAPHVAVRPCSLLAKSDRNIASTAAHRKRFNRHAPLPLRFRRQNLFPCQSIPRGSRGAEVQFGHALRVIRPPED